MGEKQAYLSVLLMSTVDGFYFPDALVHSSDQAKSAADLVGVTIPVAMETALNDHFNELAATPTFTQHMNVFEGEDAMQSMTTSLGKEFGLTMPADDFAGGISCCSCAPRGTDFSWGSAGYDGECSDSPPSSHAELISAALV